MFRLLSAKKVVRGLAAGVAGRRRSYCVRTAGSSEPFGTQRKSGTLIGAIHYLDGLLGFSDRRVSFLSYTGRRPCIDDNALKVVRIHGNILAFLSGSEEHCFSFTGELQKLSNKVQQSIDEPLNISDVAQMGVDKIPLLQNQMTGDDDQIGIILIGPTMLKEMRACLIRVSLFRSTFTWLRAMDEGDGDSFIVDGSGSGVAAEILKYMHNPKGTKEEAMDAILLASNEACLLTNSVGGDFYCFNLHHWTEEMQLQVFTPIDVQLGDLGIMNRILILRAPRLSYNIYEDEVSGNIKPWDFNQDGAYCTTYFFSSGIYRYWRIFTAEEEAENVLVRVLIRFQVLPLISDDGFYHLSGKTPQKTDCSIALCTVDVLRKL